MSRNGLTLVYETHATTVDNETGISTGWLPGELSERGRAEAVALGDRRRDDGLDLVLSSDLRRAVQTATLAFGRASAPPVRLDARLRECDYGALNGAPVSLVHGLRTSHVSEPFPAGQSYQQVTDGVDALLAELRQEHPGGRVLLVGHAATRFALDRLVLGTPLATSLARPFAWQPGWVYELS